MFEKESEYLPYIAVLKLYKKKDQILFQIRATDKMAYFMIYIYASVAICF
jgi:hypothetical protein